MPLLLCSRGEVEATPFDAEIEGLVCDVSAGDVFEGFVFPLEFALFDGAVDVIEHDLCFELAFGDSNDVVKPGQTMF